MVHVDAAVLSKYGTANSFCEGGLEVYAGLAPGQFVHRVFAV